MRRIGIIAASILLFLSSMHLFADQQIQGTVVDEQGEPVIGATIVVKAVSYTHLDVYKRQADKHGENGGGQVDPRHDRGGTVAA